MLGVYLLLASLLVPQNPSLTTNSVTSDKGQSQLVRYEPRFVTFDNDPQLRIKTSLRSLEAPFPALWEGFTRKARVVIQREDAAREFDNSTLGVFCSDTSVHDLMDAVAASVLARWEAIPKGYRFLVSSSELDSAYLPKSERFRDLNRKGMDFMRQVKNLPGETRRRLESGESLPYGALSPAMQALGKDMLHTIMEEELQKLPQGTQLAIESEDYSQASIKLSREPAKGFDSFYISLAKQGAGSAMWNVNNYEQRRAEGLQPGTASEKSKVYAPKKYEISRDDALESPLMKRVVTLQLRSALLPQVLRKLHEEYGLNFVCDAVNTFPRPATVQFKSLSLGAALDRLTELYPNTEWELRKSNILVYRSASNPARDPSKGHEEFQLSRRSQR
ncbi:MAG: hypothetical protein NT023_01535 [Armatimonadetes bacterium]|nr:hypothetical protein [Armatimonadota bacterium]